MRLLKKILPSSIKIKLLDIINIRKDYILKRFAVKKRKQQANIVLDVKNKRIIKLIFFVIFDSVWKYEEVYRLFNDDPKFDTSIVVIPMVKSNKPNMVLFEKTIKTFSEKRYTFVSSYNQENNEWIDIKKTINPDIVFFTNPHGLTFDKYYIYNYLDKLTCYVPYSFNVVNLLRANFNQKFHHLLWMFFVETKEHQQYAQKYISHIPNNVYLTGFPGLDVIYNPSYKPKEVWKKIEMKNPKKIIWAPHHTIKGQGHSLDYSSFIEYADFFIELLETRDDIQIAFKPHPLLKEKLYKHKGWGKELTDKYYQTWTNIKHGQLETGAYIDLFYTSDAMITDSASFTVEYLYFDKPYLFTKRDSSILKRFNKFGRKIFSYMYHGKSQIEVLDFINNIVLLGNDPLKIKRNEFLNKVILPSNNKTASTNIFNNIKEVFR